MVNSMVNELGQNLEYKFSMLQIGFLIKISCMHGMILHEHNHFEHAYLLLSLFPTGHQSSLPF